MRKYEYHLGIWVYPNTSQLAYYPISFTITLDVLINSVEVFNVVHTEVKRQLKQRDDIREIAIHTINFLRSFEENESPKIN